MIKVVSNKKQLSRLVQLMEKNQDVSKGLCSKEIAQNKWKEFTKELNRLGPPEREWNKWQRVWSDLKVKIKKKQLQNKFLMTTSTNEGATQPGQPLTSSEEAVVKLMELEILSDPLKKNQDYMNNIEMLITDNLCNKNISQINEEDNLKKTKQKQKSKMRNQALILLEQQNNEQKQFYENIINIMGVIRKSTKITELYTKKIFKLKEHKCKEILKIKRKKLEIYKQYVQSKKTI